MATTLLRLFWSSFKIGLLAFGGGNTAIPLLEADAVPQWISRQEFAELVGLNFAFPGVSILKLAGMVGLRAAGVPGLLVATVGLAGPGLLLTIFAYGLVSRYRDNVYVGKALLAMQYAAVVLLMSSALNIFRAAGPTVKAPVVLGLAALFAATQLLSLSPVLIILVAVAAGVWVL